MVIEIVVQVEISPDLQESVLGHKFAEVCGVKRGLPPVPISEKNTLCKV